MLQFTAERKRTLENSLADFSTPLQIQEILQITFKECGFRTVADVKYCDEKVRRFQHNKL